MSEDFANLNTIIVWFTFSVGNTFIVFIFFFLRMISKKISTYPTLTDSNIHWNFHGDFSKTSSLELSYLFPEQAQSKHYPYVTWPCVIIFKH